MAERSVNKAILVGRLGADAETRFTQNGTAVSRVSLAMNRQWTDSDNQVHEETDWMSIVIWKKETLTTYLTKGTKLSGAHDNRVYAKQRFMRSKIVIAVPATLSGRFPSHKFESPVQYVSSLRASSPQETFDFPTTND